MKRLPIGIQSFEKLINNNALYIDKTRHIYELITTGDTYFLSRPRRFGKSLLISTLAAIFQGKRSLFDGLSIAQSDWQWQTFPIIRIDFSNFSLDTPEQLTVGLQQTLHDIAAHYQVSLTETGDLKRLFRTLIIQLAKLNPVVILIDEYDKAIIHHLGKNTEIAKQNRDILKNFYEVIKASDEYLQFVLLTGISKFSKMSVFSGLNNLNDISMHHRYADLVGCTEQEIDENFTDYVQKLAEAQQLSVAKVRDKMRQWYNGFRFTKSDIKVYTPYSLLLLFHNLDFANYWFSSATPTFLINLIRDQSYDIQAIEAKNIDAMAFTSYDIDNLRVLPLLVQTGYLTIAQYHRDYDAYDLAYTNFEVRQAFTQHLAELLTGVSPELTTSHLLHCIQHLQANHLAQFFQTLQIFFANIPYQIQLPHEYYYQTIFYVLFKLLGLRIHAEIQTNDGRVDAVIETATHIYVMEFKFNGSAEQALQQIHDKRYYQPYLHLAKTIVLLGINFDQQGHNLDDYQVEILPE